MLKVIDLEMLWEDVEYEYDEDEANDVERYIKESLLGRLWDNEYSRSYIFPEENQEKMLKLIPNNVDTNIVDFTKFVSNLGEAFEFFIFGKLRITASEVFSRIITDLEEGKYELMKSQDIAKEFDYIIIDTLSGIVDRHIIEIRQEFIKYSNSK